MAEIKIEKNKAIWPWIVGIIILALLVYLIGFNDRKKKDQENPVTMDLINAKENNLTVAAFSMFMEEDTRKMELDHT